MNHKLEEALAAPMKTILAVRACFDYCDCADDIKEVIKKIPPKFGQFEIKMASERDGYFMVQNLFEKDGVTKSQLIAHDFYKDKEE